MAWLATYRGRNTLVCDESPREPWRLRHSSDDKSDRFLEHLKPLRGALESYARKMVRRAAGAEDALQEAVMKAYRDFDRYAEGTNFRAWVFKYLNLEIFSANRRSTRHDHDLLPFEPLATTEDQAFDHIALDALPEVEGDLLDRCDAELASAFAKLTETERAVLLLRALAELKYHEIGDVLGLPVGTVMSHLSRSRRRLREELAAWAAAHNLGARPENETA